MIKFSLRNKVLLFSVLIALIPLGFAAYTNISITRDELKSSVNEETSLAADNLAQAIRTAVTNPEIRQNARACGEAIRAEDGVGNAVKVIERYFGAPGRET